jgi:hypothetical protein
MPFLIIFEFEFVESDLTDVSKMEKNVGNNSEITQIELWMAQILSIKLLD